MVLTVYKDYLVVFFTKSKEIDWLRVDEVSHVHHKKYKPTMIRTWIYDNKTEIKKARDAINKEIADIPDKKDAGS